MRSKGLAPPAPQFTPNYNFQANRSQFSNNQSSNFGQNSGFGQSSSFDNGNSFNKNGERASSPVRGYVPPAPNTNFVKPQYDSDNGNTNFRRVVKEYL